MTNNPFSDFFKNFDFSNNASSFNWDQVVANSNKNAKAFNNAAKAAADGIQVVTNRQVTLLQKQFEAYQALFASCSAAKTPEAALEELTQSASKNTEAALASSGEFVEILSKSTEEATKIISDRALEIIADYSKGSTAGTSSSKTKKSNAA